MGEVLEEPSSLQERKFPFPYLRPYLGLYLFLAPIRYQRLFHFLFLFRFRSRHLLLPLPLSPFQCHCQYQVLPHYLFHFPRQYLIRRFHQAPDY